MNVKGALIIAGTMLALAGVYLFYPPIAAGNRYDAAYKRVDWPAQCRAATDAQELWEGLGFEGEADRWRGIASLDCLKAYNATL